MQAKHHLACLNHLLSESGLLRQVIHARLQSNSYHQFLFEALEIVGYIIGRVFCAFPRKALNTHSLSSLGLKLPKQYKGYQIYTVRLHISIWNIYHLLGENIHFNLLSIFILLSIYVFNNDFLDFQIFSLHLCLLYVCLLQSFFQMTIFPYKDVSLSCLDV